MKSLKTSKKLFSLLVILTLIFTLSVTASAQNPCVVDSANLFNESEKYALEEKVQETILYVGVDMVIVTTDTTDGKTSEAYSDDYFDYNGYGTGAERSGMLLLINMSDREIHISLRGSATNFFSDENIESALDIIQPYASSGEYAQGAEAFLEYVQNRYIASLDSYGNYGNGQEYYQGSEMAPDVQRGSEDRQMDPLVVALLAVIIGLGAGAIVCFSVHLQYKMKLGGYKYPFLEKSSLHTTESTDVLVEKHVTQHRINNDRHNNRGSFGGGSGHISSSGASHRGSTRGF